MMRLLKAPHEDTDAATDLPGSIDGRVCGGCTIQCYICHGDDLTGLGDVPGIAGMSPIYVARQLWDIKYGARS